MAAPVMEGSWMKVEGMECELLGKDTEIFTLSTGLPTGTGVQDASAPQWQSETSNNTGSKWKHETVMLLLSLVEEKQAWKQFPHKQNKKRKIWEWTVEEMAKHGHIFSVECVAKKWANLYDSYRRISKRAKRTGEDPSTWPYFDEIQEMLGNNEATANGTNGHPISKDSGYNSERFPSPGPSTSGGFIHRWKTNSLTDRVMKRKAGETNDNLFCMKKTPQWFAEFAERQENRMKEKNMKDAVFHTQVLHLLAEKNEALRNLTDVLSALIPKPPVQIVQVSNLSSCDTN